MAKNTKNTENQAVNPEEKSCELLNMPQEDQVLMNNQYEKLIAARNFHYENLNKWLMSFYLIIGALFIALYSLHTANHMHRHMELCVSIVGYIVSLAAYLSCKGYAYWEINWIMLVHYFEKKYLKHLAADKHKENKELQLRNRVYSIFVDKDANKSLWYPTSGANISTTKVALVVTLFIAVLWGTMAFYQALNIWPIKMIDTRFYQVSSSFGASILSSIVLILLGGWRLKSNINGLDDLHLDNHKESKNN